MSTETNKSIARRFFESFSKNDINTIEKLFSEDYVQHFPARKETYDKEGSLEVLQQYTKAFPDMKFNIELQVAEADLVCTRITANGTHKADFQGIAPSNK